MTCFPPHNTDQLHLSHVHNKVTRLWALKFCAWQSVGDVTNKAGMRGRSVYYFMSQLFPLFVDRE